MKYVPILKCKRGEQQALKHLTDQVKDNICPLIEIPYSTDTNKGSICDLISSFWTDRPFMFYLAPDWYDDLEEIDKLIKDPDGYFYALYREMQGIPVLDLSIVDSISDWSFLSERGIAIRLRNNDFREIENTLNPLFDKTPVKRVNTDLVFDMQHVTHDELFSKESVLKAATSDLNAASEFRSIIVASGSFPNQLHTVGETNRIYRFPRIEPHIMEIASKLATRYRFKYIYSDYGLFDFQEISFVPGMSPNFKIKYTTGNEYIYIKGLSIKRGGLDLKNVQALCQTLISSTEDFCGEDFSWGDNAIFNLANNQMHNGGNLTTWVSYATNHHITLIESLL